MNGWKRSGRGAKARLTASLEAQEVALLRNLIAEVRQMLSGRADETPADELSILTGIRTGPTTRPTTGCSPGCCPTSPPRTRTSPPACARCTSRR